MKKELQDKFYQQFDHMFRERHLPMSETCMCWGLDVGAGWFDLLWKLCEGIQQELDKSGNEKLKENFAVVQVKEKFAGLRFYVHGSNDVIDKLINEAEDRSYSTCEVCGKPGSVDKSDYYILTLCDEHKQLRRRSREKGDEEFQKLLLGEQGGN